MSWSRRFRLRQNLKGNLWLVPVLGTLTGTLAAVASAWLDRGISLPHDLQYSAATTETVLSAIVGGMVALTGFVVTVTVLVVQMATGTFSPRYLRIWYRDSALKAVLAVLLGTLAFSFSLLRRVGANSVPSLSVTFAGVLVVVGLVLFLAFLDRYLHRLRPVSVAEIVGRAGAAAIAGYASRGAVRSSASAPTDSTSTAVVRAERSGSIQAVNLPALVRWASRSGRLLVMRYGVGDFVVRDSKLFEVYGDPLSAAEERELRGLVALGVERTIDQDPAFALRIMVDIANRALSPAVNDPTTATQVMDYLSDFLTRIGTIEGLEGTTDHLDENGSLRLRVPAPSWDDFLALGTTEIRLYGGSSIQVVRRLRALLEQLREVVRPEYTFAVEREIERLDATVAEHFGGTFDLERARGADRQGIGGATPLA